MRREGLFVRIGSCVLAAGVVAGLRGCDDGVNLSGELTVQAWRDVQEQFGQARVEVGAGSALDFGEGRFERPGSACSGGG